MDPEDLPYILRNPHYRQSYFELAERLGFKPEFAWYITQTPEGQALCRRYGLKYLLPPDHDILQGIFSWQDSIASTPLFRQTVTLLKPPGVTTNLWFWEPAQYLSQGRFMFVALDLEATDASIIEDLKKKMKEMRGKCAVKQRTKRNQPEFNPLGIWDEVLRRLNKEEWSDDEAKHVLWKIANEIYDKYQSEIPKQSIESLKREKKEYKRDNREWYQQLKIAYDKAHNKIMSF